MEGSEQDGTPQRRHVRIPVDAKVDLVYDSFASFISDYVSNVSRGGMFISTTQVRPPGSRLTFELRLRDDYPLIRGRGEVVWVRRDGTGDAERATGMAVRFIELDQQSAELIERMIEQHRREGGTPFAIGESGSATAEEEASGEETAAPVVAAGESQLELEGEGLPGGDVFALPEEPPAGPPPAAPVDVFSGPPAEPEPPPPEAEPPAYESREPVREELPPIEPWPEPEPSAADDELPLSFGFEEEPASSGSPASPEVKLQHGVEERFEPVVSSPRRRRRRWPLVAGVLSLLVVVAAVAALWQRGLITLPFLEGGAAAPTPEPAPTATAVPAPAAPVADGAVAPVAPAAAGISDRGPGEGQAAATPAPSAPTPVEVVPPEPATAVESIGLSQEGAATVLRIVTNGSLERSRLREYRLENPPRQVLRIAGITEPYDDHPLQVGGPLLTRVRVGFHPEMSPPELHVVVDLAGAGVKLDSLKVSGADVVLRFTQD